MQQWHLSKQPGTLYLGVSLSLFQDKLSKDLIYRVTTSHWLWVDADAQNCVEEASLKL